MLGGYQILDLSGMSVSMGSDVSITDLDVLKQLLALREHIEDNYDYSKPLNKRLKAVMIRLRDAESGEKTEGCLWGNLLIIDDNLSFSIDAIVSVSPLKVLQINVVFEKKQDDDGNDYYDIKSAKYEYKGGEDVVTVTDIKNIPSATIKKLDCGDIVLKKDSSGLHAYIVSFRNATGICLTYTDASCIETQSYDKVGQNWVYNSEDKTPNLLDAQTENDVKALIEGGTIENAKPLYFHPISIIITGTNIGYFTLFIINNSSTAFTGSTLINYIKNTSGRYLVNGAYKTSSYYLSPSYVSTSENAIYLIGVDNQGDIHASSQNVIDFESIIASANIFNDNVNKIN